MGTWIDITLELFPGCPDWPGDGRGLEHRRLSTIAGGGQSNTSGYTCSAHLGTHVDAPRHFIDGGATIEQLDPSLFVGPATVVDVQTPGHVTADGLAAAVSEWPERLLLRTRNSALGGALSKADFDRGYCGVDEDAARLIVAHGVKLLGIDYYSIGPFDDVAPTHRTILGAGIPALEAIDLRRVRPGAYTLIALPIKLRGFDGAPVRAVLATK